MNFSKWLPQPERSRRILALALPIIGGMTSQNILNLVDTAMVGTLGAAALAGVGLASFLNFMAIAIVIGLASAVQATAARRYGEGQFTETALPLNGGLLLALLLGIPLTIILILAAPWIMELLMDDPEVVKQGTPYFQARLIAIVAIGMNFSFRGYWNAVDHSRLYMQTLLIMHSVNILLNYMLIFGKFGAPALGTAGAGIGTALSTFIGTGIYFYLGHRFARDAGFLHAMPHSQHLRSLVRLSLPASIQQWFFAAGFTALFWIIGQIGTHELAVANVLINIVMVVVLPGMGLGLAAASLVGHALGRQDIDDAHAWAWDVCRIGSLGFLMVSLLMIAIPGPVLGIFLHTPELIDLGRLPLQLVGLGILLDGIGLILMQSLLGAGDSKTVMVVATGLQWLLFLPLAWLLGPQLGYGLTVVWVAFLGYRALQSIIFITLWQRRGWAAIQV